MNQDEMVARIFELETQVARLEWLATQQGLYWIKSNGRFYLAKLGEAKSFEFIVKGAGSFEAMIDEARTR